MNLCRCEKGHFYDKEKYIYCPHCYLPNNDLMNTDSIIEEYNPIDGEWEFLDLIGVGGFGRVYRLVNKTDGKEKYSALKVISIDERDCIDGKNIENKISEIQKEVELMYKLNSCENVVKIYNYFIYNRRQEKIWDLLILMELLTPIDKYFKKELFTESDILNLAKDICSALIFCEKFNIIHQDIKPRNIFVSPDGKYKLGDFGSAKILHGTKNMNEIQYTLHYCAPEVYYGQEACHSSDIYSLGITLYKFLNYNRFPFLPKPPNIITNNILNQAHNKRMGDAVLQSPDFSSELFSKIILKACAYNKENRYKNAFELLKDLQMIEYVNDKIIIGYVEPIEDLIDFRNTTNLSFDTSNLTINPINPRSDLDEMLFNIDIDSSFNTVDFNMQTVPDPNTVGISFSQSNTSDSTIEDCNYVGDSTYEGETENLYKRIIIKMINWIGFTCIIALIPLFIYILFWYLFDVNMSLDNKIITDLFYFGLTLSVVTIREMVTMQLWKKEKIIYLVALLIILIIFIISTVFFGAMTMNEMDLLKAEIHNNDLLVAALIISIASFATGSIIQIWEEMLNGNHF